MTHSQQTIVDLTLQLLRPLQPVRGGYYASGLRPLNSTSEDLVVGFLSGNADQVQEGYIVINIYTPMLYGTDGVRYHNHDRCLALEQQLTALPDLLNPKAPVRYTLFGMARTIEEPTLHQSVVTAQYRFKHLTT